MKKKIRVTILLLGFISPLMAKEDPYSPTAERTPMKREHVFPLMKNLVKDRPNVPPQIVRGDVVVDFDLDGE